MTIGSTRAFVKPAGVTVATILLVSSVTIGFLVAAGDARLVILAVAAPFLVLGMYRPDLLFYTELALVLLFDEGTYGVIGAESVLRVHSLGFANGLIRIDEILLLALATALMLKRVSGFRRSKRSGLMTIAAGALSLLVIGRIALAAVEGVRYTVYLHPFGGVFVAFLALTWWAFDEVLESVDMNRLIGFMMTLCGARASFALLRYFFAEGDPANAYRDLGVKVALWESADHLVFAFLVAIVLGAWFTRMKPRKTLLLWSLAVAPMVLTTLLSFRRTGWLGLLMVVAIICLVHWRRGGALVAALAVPLIPMASGVIGRRFSGAGSIFERVFADAISSTSASRFLEMGLAWTTIRQAFWFGAGPAGERSGGYVWWSALIVHNGLLFVWMKFGVFAVLLILVLIIASAGLALRGVMRSHDGLHRTVAIACLAITPYLLLELLSGTPLIEIRHVVLMGLFLAIATTVGSLVPREN